MSLQQINLGNYANDGTGDDLRSAFTKVNANFLALDTAAAISDGINLGSGAGVFASKSAEKLQFKSLTSIDNSVVISNTATSVNLSTLSRIQNDPAPQLGANLGLNGHNIYGPGDVQSTIYGYSVPTNVAVNALLVESNGLNIDLGSFITPTGSGFQNISLQPIDLENTKGYTLDYGLFSDVKINNHLNFGDFGEDPYAGNLSLGGNFTTIGAYPITLRANSSVNLTLPPTGTLATTQNGIGQFSAVTSAQFSNSISDETGSGVLVFNSAPTINNLNLTGTVTGTVAISGGSTTITDTTVGTNYTLKIKSATGAVFAIGTGSDIYGVANDVLNFAQSGYAPYNVTASQLSFNTPTQAGAISIATTGAVTIPGHLTVEGVTSTGAVGTGRFVFDTSPTIVTPTVTTSIATGSTTFSFVNTTANTLNIGGAVTALAISNTTTAGVTASIATAANVGASTLTFGGAITGNTIKLAGTAAGTINLTTDVTTGIVNLYTSVSTGAVNIGSAAAGKLVVAFNTSATSSSSGALQVTGGVAVGGNIYRGGLEIAPANYISIASSGTYLLSTTITENILLVTNTALTATLTFPASPVDGQKLRFTVTTNNVTLALTAGPTLVGTFAGAASTSQTFTYIYRSTGTTWYRQ